MTRHDGSWTTQDELSYIERLRQDRPRYLRGYWQGIRRRTDWRGLNREQIEVAAAEALEWVAAGGKGE
jgi:hypothetical protein